MTQSRLTDEQKTQAPLSRINILPTTSTAKINKTCPIGSDLVAVWSQDSKNHEIQIFAVKNLNKWEDITKSVWPAIPEIDKMIDIRALSDTDVLLFFPDNLLLLRRNLTNNVFNITPKSPQLSLILYPSNTHQFCIMDKYVVISSRNKKSITLLDDTPPDSPRTRALGNPDIQINRMSRRRGDSSTSETKETKVYSSETHPMNYSTLHILDITRNYTSIGTIPLGDSTPEEWVKSEEWRKKACAMEVMKVLPIDESSFMILDGNHELTIVDIKPDNTLEMTKLPRPPRDEYRQSGWTSNVYDAQITPLLTGEILFYNPGREICRCTRHPWHMAGMKLAIKWTALPTKLLTPDRTTLYCLDETKRAIYQVNTRTTVTSILLLSLPDKGKLSMAMTTDGALMIACDGDIYLYDTSYSLDLKSKANALFNITKEYLPLPLADLATEYLVSKSLFARALKVVTSPPVSPEESKIPRRTCERL